MREKREKGRKKKIFFAFFVDNLDRLIILAIIFFFFFFGKKFEKILEYWFCIYIYIHVYSDMDPRICSGYFESNSFVIVANIHKHVQRYLLYKRLRDRRGRI